MLCDFGVFGRDSNRIDTSGDIPEEYSTAELYIGDKFIGAFNNGFISFVPEVFGDVECEIAFLNSEGMTIKVLTDTNQLKRPA